MMHSNLIILAGGASSRMKSSSVIQGLSEAEIKEANSQSKAMIRLSKDDRPLLDYLLFNAEKAGYKQVFLVVGEQAEAFKSYYGNSTKNNSFRTLQISYATQFIPDGRTKPLGTSDALQQTLDQYPQLKEQTFSVCNSDNLYSVDALLALRKCEVANAFISYDRDGLLFNMSRISRFALVLLDKEYFLIDIIEKPSKKEADGYRDKLGKFRVSMNIFKLNGNDIYPFLKNCPIHPERNEKELPTAVLNFCKANRKSIIGLAFNEHVPDLTSKEDIAILKKYILDNYRE